MNSLGLNGVQIGLIERAAVELNAGDRLFAPNRAGMILNGAALQLRSRPAEGP